jgi:predicted phosphodiesterase
MILLGDVHGDWEGLTRIIRRYPDSSILQVGDMGVGYPGAKCPKDLGSKFKFIRGNHDNPEVCRQRKEYIGDYKFFPDKSLLAISGAFSIDWKHRIPGRTWWENEELSIPQLTAIIDHIEEWKPKYIITHDCPASVLPVVFPGKQTPDRWKNRTSQAFDALFERYQPTYWVFGHHHQTGFARHNGTVFHCISVMGLLEIDDLEW